MSTTDPTIPPHDHVRSAFERVLQGERSGLDDVYRLCAPALYGILRKIVRTTPEADDLLQETFVRIWTRRASYAADRGTPFTWMLNIARNLAIDHLRSAHARNMEIHDELENVGIADPTLIDGSRADTVDMSTHVDTLPAEQRQIVDLVYYQGYTQQEIADEFGIPLGTVKSRLRLAMKSLRTIYGVDQ